MQSVKQIASELTIFYHPLQIPMSGRNDANIYLLSARTTQPFKFMFLQNPQQFGLQLERNVTYFIKKQSSLVRDLEPAGLSHDGAGKGTLLVPKQLALEEAGGDGGTIQPDKRPIPALAQIMNGPGDELLSRSRFSLNQYTGIGWCYDLDLAKHTPQGSASAYDQLKVQLAAVFIFETYPLLVEIVLQFSQFAVDQRILYCNCHLAGHLRQEIDFVLRIGDFLALAQRQNAQDSTPDYKWQDAATALESHCRPFQIVVQIQPNDKTSGDACPWLPGRENMSGQCLHERVHCSRVKHAIVGKLGSV